MMPSRLNEDNSVIEIITHSKHTSISILGRVKDIIVSWFYGFHLDTAWPVGK
jgi:hypothetical protein